MNKTTKISIVVAVALLAAVAAVFLSSHDPAIPTAPAPRGQFATDRASEETGSLPPLKP